MKSIKEVGRIRGIAHSPICSYLHETMQGVSTIRAFNLTEQFEKRNMDLLNRGIIATQFEIAVHQFFHIRVQLMSMTFMAIVTFMCIYLRDSRDPIILSMMMGYILHINGSVISLLYCYLGFEGRMIDCERSM